MEETGKIIVHDMVNEPKDLTPKKRGRPAAEDFEARLRREWEHDSKLVRGVFRRHDGNTDPLEFSYKKYKWDKLERYKLFHNQVHTIPLGVARHLNDDCKTPIYGHIASLEAADATSKEAPVIGYNNRFSFAGTEFSSVEKEPVRGLIER